MSSYSSGIPKLGRPTPRFKNPIIGVNENVEQFSNARFGNVRSSAKSRQVGDAKSSITPCKKALKG